jgi:regulator of protease activity HflC (stomatin/prohibitin superfamily)
MSDQSGGKGGGEKKKFRLFRTNAGDEDGQPFPPWGRIAAILFVVMLLLIIIGVNFRGIDAGYKGVIVNGPGGPSRVEIDEGWHFNLGYMFSNIKVVRWNTQVRDMAGSTGLTVRSSDNLNIQMDISVVYHLQPDKVADITIDYGDYREILDRYVRNVPRNVASNFTGEYIGGIGRVVVEEEILRLMTTELAVYSIVLEDVLLRSVDLPDTVDIAIEEKLAAQQKVVTAELQRQSTVIAAMADADVLRILAEGARNATIIQANGTAEAIRIVIDQLRISDPDLTNATWAYLTILYIQALTDPDSNVSFVIITDGSTPIIIQPRP